RHSDAQPIEKVNRVRLLAFLNDDRLLSVAEDGIILKWNTADRRPQPPEVVGQFPATNDLLSLRCIAIDPKSAWLAAGTKQERGARTPKRIEFMSLHDQERRQSILLEEAEFVDSIAFDPSGSRLAVAVGSLARMSDGFATETGADVRLYDVGGDIPQLARRLPPCYAAEALAFHPNGTELAVAGGADHEVDLWDISARPKSKQTLVGPGRSLWGVGLSPDNRYVGFQSRRAENAKGVNHRGDGPW